MTLKEIQDLYTYTEWANGVVLEAAEKQLTPEQLLRNVGISHKSIFETLLHTAAAEWIWLERWQGRAPMGPDAWGQWTIETCDSLQRLRERWQSIIENRRTYLAGLSDAEIPRQLSFTRLNGDTASLPLEQQMLHVVNHSTLHRGQVVGLIRQLGITPPATDLLFYLLPLQK
jgi:uncharacterized damage-inducible protein DinB